MQSKIIILVLVIAVAFCYVSSMGARRCCSADAPIICIDLNVGDNCGPNNQCVVNLGRLLKIEGTCAP
ncbi:hypothetical protein Ddc_18238 [Ditylenchus destructor]|nr:hypothetical protein Ddc_18238 [Ditylenchus destructor]